MNLHQLTFVVQAFHQLFVDLSYQHQVWYRQVYLERLILVALMLTLLKVEQNSVKLL